MAENLKLKIILNAAENVTRPLKNVFKSSKKVKLQFAKMRAELKKLESTQQLIETHKTLSRNLGKTAANMDKAQKQIASMGRAIASANQPTKRQIQQFKQAKQQLNRLKIAHKQQKQTLLDSLQSLKKANIHTKKLSQSEQNLARQINLVNQRMTTQSKKLDLIKNKERKLAALKNIRNKRLQSKANMRFVGLAGYGMGSRMLGGMGGVLKPSVDFEQGMSGVASMSGISKTSEGFKKLQKQAHELGASTAFTSVEIAGGMEFLAKSGFKVQEVLNTMSGMVNLARAGRMSLTDTADISSNVLKSLNLDPSEMDRVSDVLASTFTNSNTDLEMLGDTLKYVASAVAEVKKTNAGIEEVGALAGLLGDAGIQASMAGTTLRAIYTRISKNSAALKALKELKITTTDALGNLRPLPEILAEIAKKTEGMGNAKRLGMFIDIAGKNAGTGMARLVKEGGSGAIEKFIKVLKASKGTAAKIAESLDDNLAGDIIKMSSAWDGLKRTIGDTQTGGLRGLTQQITKLIQTFNKWASEHPKLIRVLFGFIGFIASLITVIGGFALAIAGVLGPIAILRYIIGSFGMKSLGLITSMKFLSKLLWNIGKVILPFLGKTLLWLSRIFLMNPIGLIITGIAVRPYKAVKNAPSIRIEKSR